MGQDIPRKVPYKLKGLIANKLHEAEARVREIRMILLLLEGDNIPEKHKWLVARDVPLDKLHHSILDTLIAAIALEEL